MTLNNFPETELSIPVSFQEYSENYTNEEYLEKLLDQLTHGFAELDKTFDEKNMLFNFSIRTEQALLDNQKTLVFSWQPYQHEIKVSPIVIFKDKNVLFNTGIYKNSGSETINQLTLAHRPLIKLFIISFFIFDHIANSFEINSGLNGEK